MFEWDDLSESQQKSYDIKKRKYRNVQLEVVRVMTEIEKIHTVILESANIYTAMNMRSASVQKILQSLAHKFKKKSEDVRRQIDRRYEALRDSYPVKGKIESWIMPMGVLERRNCRFENEVHLY